MEPKPWLSAVNVITLITLVFICIALAIALAYGDIGLGLLIGAFPMVFIAIAVIVIIGFLLVVALNYLMHPKDNSGWLIVLATFLFIPATICLIALGAFASLAYINK